jgi:pimeloyl-ACP methyl ester carboxylesterase
MRESYKKIVNEDLRADAARVENSVLIVQGERDFVTPMREADAYRSVMKNARLTTIDGGHFAFAENPVAFNILVEEFLQDD